MPPVKRNKPSSSETPLEKWLLLPDTHVPYHDRRAFGLALSAAQGIGCKNVAVLGDFADFYAVSSHPKPPDRRKSIQWEIEEVNTALDLIDTMFPGDKKYVSGNHECLTPDHEVLTITGWKPISEVLAGEMVGSMTGSGFFVWQPVTATRAYPFSGDLGVAQTHSVRFRATPTHRLIGKSTATDAQFRERTVDNLWRSGPAAKLEIPTTAKSGYSDLPGVTDDELRLLGWFLTDGGLSSMCLYQSKPHGVSAIKTLLDRLGYEYKETIRNRPPPDAILGVKVKSSLPAHEIRIRGEGRRRLCHLLGLGEWRSSVKGKKPFPMWLHNTSDRQAAIFLQSVIDGDGCRPSQAGAGTACCLYGTHKFLTEIQILAITHGWSASLVDRTKRGVYAHTALNLKKASLSRLESKSVRPEHYEGPVHCITVAETENFFVRHQGRVHVTGNSRLDRYMSEKAPELHGTLTVPAQFRLKERGWAFTPYKDFTKIGKLHLTHDAGKAGRGAIYDALNAFQGNVVIGHVHRLSYAVEGSATGQPHVTASLGWLGDKDQCDYMFKVRANRDWALGFGVLYKEPCGNVHLTPVPIVDYKVVLEGKLFRA